MAGWVTDPTSGQPVYQGDDGLVHLADASGKIQTVAPADLPKLLGGSEYDRELRPATADELNAHQAQQQWDQASFGTKADFYAREGIKGAADAATAVPRAAFGAGMAAAKALAGSTAEVANPLEALSGENLVEKLDTLTGGQQAAQQAAEQARQFSEVAPGGKFVANAAGFVAGGAALKGLGAVGDVLAGSELLGGGSKLARAGSVAAEGAAQGYVAGAEDAWVKDTEFTSDAAVASMGMGAALGGALGGAVEGGKALVGGAKSLLAEKVFGRARPSAESAEAVTQMAEDVMGTKPPEGFASKFKDAMEYVRDKVETAQSVASGVAKEDLEKFGGLRWDENAMSGREAFANRVENRQAAAKDLTEALQTMHTEGRTIMDEVSRATGKKQENIAHLLTGDADTMAEAASGKAQAIENSIAKLDEVMGREGEYSAMGGKKSVADLRYTMEKAVDRVNGASTIEESVNALDEFKARMDAAYKNASATVRSATSDVARTQAKARAEFAQSLAEDMRGFLEQEDIWGKFGPVQRETNQAYTRVLENDKFLSSHLLEKISDGYGAPVYVVDPAKVERYVSGLGTTKSQLVDGLLRDSIAARKDLANSIVKGYGLEAHGGRLAALTEATEKAQGILKQADKNVASANVIEGMMGTAGSAHGGGLGGLALGGALGASFSDDKSTGAGLGVAAALLMSPGKLIMQAVSLRAAALKMGKTIDGSVNALMSGTSAAARATARIGEGVAPARQAIVRESVSAKDQTQKYDRITKGLVASVADPVGTANHIGDSMGAISHSAVRDMMISSSMRAANFLNSKIPQPVFAGTPLTPNQLMSVAPAEKAKFLRYYDAVNDPGIVFRELETGTVAPEHIEALKVCYPALYARAQMAVFEAAHDNKNQLPYQTKISLAQLFDNPAAIEPTLDRGFMDRVSAAAMQGGQAEAAKQNAPAPAGPQMPPMGPVLQNIQPLRI